MGEGRRNFIAGRGRERDASQIRMERERETRRTSHCEICISTMMLKGSIVSIHG